MGGRLPLLPPQLSSQLHPTDRLLLFPAADAWHSLKLLSQTGFGTSRWPSLLQKGPPAYGVGHNCHNLDPSSSCANTPAAFPCVTYGPKCIHVFSNPGASNMVLLISRLLLSVVFFFLIRLCQANAPHAASYRKAPISSEVAPCGCT